MLPDLIPAYVFGQVAEATGWPEKLVRAVIAQATDGELDPQRLTFERAVWRELRPGGAAGKPYRKFDGARPSGRVGKAANLYARMTVSGPEGLRLARLSHRHGFGQVLGAEHRYAGYEQLDAFAADQLTVAGQARTMIGYALSSPRLGELAATMDPTRRGRWRLGDVSEFAAIWSGPDWRRRNWDKGLARRLGVATKRG